MSDAEQLLNQFTPPAKPPLMANPTNGDGSPATETAAPSSIFLAEDAVAEQPASPSPPRCFCPDACFLHPDRWIESPATKYRGRIRVECGRCGKWIGYRPTKTDTKKRA